MGNSTLGIMSKKVIYTASLQDFRPLVWYGVPVYERYSQLYTLLKGGLGEEYAEFLAEPVLRHNQVSWLSEYVPNGVEFTKLPPERQETVRSRLHDMLNKIKGFAAELKTASDPHQNEFGELLEMAVEVPGLECVVSDGAQIVLVAWGFSSEKSFRENFRLNSKISKPIESEPVIPPPPPSQPTPSTNLADAEKNQNANFDTQSTPHTENPTSQEVTQNPPPPPPDNTTKRRSGIPPWLWFLLGVLVALVVMFVYKGCSNDTDGNTVIGDNNGHNRDHNNDYNNGGNTGNYSYIVDEPDVIPPVDTTKIVVDPDDPGKRKILSDKVNVALAKGINLIDFAHELHGLYPEEIKVVYWDTVINLMQVQVPDGEWKQWIATLKKLEKVKLAFPNTLFEQSTPPNMKDPGLSDNRKSWYLDMVEARKAWDVTVGDTSVIVAIADNGFDLSHPEIASKVVLPYNVVTRSSNVTLAGGECSEHGTHVAGTAVAESNTLGICGIAPKCKLMPVQLGDNQGIMQSISVASGILYAIHHGASVVNLSLGATFGPITAEEQQELINNYYADETQFWNELFQFALDEDCVPVLAAGNENILAGCDAFARSGKVLVVSALQPIQSKPKAAFSNFGKYANISAPGVQIYSSVPGNAYNYLDGTSMASPIVTGAVALIKSKFPSLKASEIITIIKKTAKPLNSTPQIGPLLQIRKALDYAGGGQLLEIPDDASDLSFALGRWKSTTDLYSSENPQMPVEIYFDIKPDGTGIVTYQEGSGNKFTASLDVTFKDGRLVMRQSENAVLQGSQLYYYPCTFACEQGESGAGAECRGVWDDDNSGTDFHMTKIN